MTIEEKITVLEKELDALCNENKNIVLSSSLGAEDMLLTDIISRKQLPIDLFTIDTGRLPAATHDLLQRIQQDYAVNLKVYVPDANDLENYINRYGSNAFYESVDYRKLCCHIRKVGPLQRALKGYDVWLTGLRRSQSVTRESVQLFEYDRQFQMRKCNPLLEWSWEDVLAYLDVHHVPINSLYSEGYRSIGCEPCTRNVSEGEHERAGRWWWEKPEHRECGLHSQTTEASRELESIYEKSYM